MSKKERVDVQRDEDFKLVVLNSGLEKCEISSDDRMVTMIAKQSEISVGIDFDISTKKIRFYYPVKNTSYPKELTFTLTQFIQLLASSDKSDQANKELNKLTGIDINVIKAFEESLSGNEQKSKQQEEPGYKPKGKSRGSKKSSKKSGRSRKKKETST